MNNISQKQLVANRQNSKLGGVKTNKGKSISKYNALKHGILSQEVFLKGENKESFDLLIHRLSLELKPCSEIESLLVDRIIANIWRLKRALKGETEMIECDLELGIDIRGDLGSALRYDLANNDSLGKFTRYETSLERGLFKALHELQRIQSAHAGEKPSPPIAIDIDVSND